jgi:hypothetical protein
MDQGQYNFCIEKEKQVTELTGQGDEWPEIKAGTKVVMRVLFQKPLQSESTKACGFCGDSDYSLQRIPTNGTLHEWTVRWYIGFSSRSELRLTVESRGCKRQYQLTIHGPNQGGPQDSVPRRTIDGANMHLLRNLRVHEVVRRLSN